MVDSAACQEVIETGDQIDVYSIPTPIWHEKDGGPYIGTTAGVITSDPDTGYLNSGMYRCM
ncbi:MAG TPA: UbiD family decarboxylase domain-containing protein, partial [Chloroflexota bacterium]